MGRTIEGQYHVHRDDLMEEQALRVKALELAIEADKSTLVGVTGTIEDAEKIYEFLSKKTGEPAPPEEEKPGLKHFGA